MTRNLLLFTYIPSTATSACFSLIYEYGKQCILSAFADTFQYLEPSSPCWRQFRFTRVHVVEELEVKFDPIYRDSCAFPPGTKTATCLSLQWSFLVNSEDYISYLKEALKVDLMVEHPYFMPLHIQLFLSGQCAAQSFVSRAQHENLCLLLVIKSPHDIIFEVFHPKESWCNLCASTLKYGSYIFN